MSFNLFGKKKDSFDKNAENLVLMAKAGALSYYIPCADKFPFVFNIPPDHWDAILTVANCAYVIQQLWLLDVSISHNRKKELVNLILINLDADQPEPSTERGTQAVDDCLKFGNGIFDRGEYKDSPRFVTGEPIGIWSFWNLFGRSPESAEENGLARVIGGLVEKHFSHYWEEKS